MASETPLQSLCANCKKPATNICNGCNGVASMTSPTEDEPRTFYCSGSCQKENWVEHKSTCQRLQTRKKIYRVGEILQAIWYMYRQQVFDKTVNRIEERDGKLFIYEYYHGIEGHSPLIPFPADIANTEEDKQAVLSHLTCVDAVACTCELTRYLLSGLASRITERTYELDPARHKRMTVTVSADGVEDKVDYQHHVMTVYSRHEDPRLDPSHTTVAAKLYAALPFFDTGEHFVIDLSGAQYGYHNPITPYIQFLDRVRTMFCGDEGDELGKTKRWYEDQAKTQTGIKKLIVELNSEASQFLLGGTIGWEAKSKMKVKKLLKLPDQEFQQKLQELIKHIEDPLKAYVDFHSKNFQAQIRAQVKAQLQKRQNGKK